MKDATLFSTKKTLLGDWIAVMSHKRNDRSMKPSSARTRCIQRGEIHEFITCSLNQSMSIINEVAYLGFGEFRVGGVIEVGDLFYHENLLIGEIIGFDETHYPNHYNIIISTEKLLTGAERGMTLNNKFFIKNT